MICCVKGYTVLIYSQYLYHCDLANVVKVLTKIHEVQKHFQKTNFMFCRVG